jgi:hypothetical protein
MKMGTRRLFGRTLDIFKGGFIFDEGGTKVVEFRMYRKYNVPTIFRIAIYIHLFKPHYISFGFAINNKKPYLTFKFSKKRIDKLGWFKNEI